ncbi:MAG: AAA family ATPase [Patescibacteria group bacterium]
MYNFIFILGAQGSGKTTLARILKEKLDLSVHIDFDWIRDFHLNKKWSNANEKEEEMSLENLKYLLKNYAKNDFKNIIASGFTENNFEEVLREFENRSIVITLYLNDDKLLKQRVLTESRDSGFRDFEESIQFNTRLRDQLKYLNERKIDNTNQTPEETADQVMRLLSG